MLRLAIALPTPSARSEAMRAAGFFRPGGWFACRTIYGRLPRKAICWCRQRGMHESIRPVAGLFAPLALMGVRCFWPHNLIGLEGLVLHQARKLRSLAANHQLSPRIQCGLLLSAGALRSCGHIVLFSREQGPSDSRRFICERDNRPIEASPRREPLQPLGTAIVMFRQSKDYRAGAVDHLPP